MSVQTQEKAAADPTATLELDVEMLPALDRLFAETVALFQRLRAVAPLMRAHTDVGRDECTVLQGLSRDGSRTVADVGNDCGIPRAQAQKLVKALEKRGLLQMVDNPEKKRGKLAELTAEGRELVGTLDQREVELLTSLPLAVDPLDIHDAASALGAVRTALNDDGWRRLLEE